MKKNLLLVFISIIVAYLLSSVIFWGSPLYLVIPFVVGLLIIAIQNENKSIKYINKLLIGSLLFGFVTLVLIKSTFYIKESAQGYNFDFLNTLIYSLIFSFVSFVGGLVGIVLKGFYIKSQEREVKNN